MENVHTTPLDDLKCSILARMLLKTGTRRSYISDSVRTVKQSNKHTGYLQNFVFGKVNG